MLLTFPAAITEREVLLNYIATYLPIDPSEKANNYEFVSVK